MRMQGEKGTVIGEKSMKNEEYKKLSIKEFTKAAGRYESSHAGIYEMCKKDYPNPQAFFDSVKRCLRPNGRLVLRDVTSDNKVLVCLMNTLEMPLANICGHGDVQVPTRDVVIKCCKKAGLKVEKEWKIMRKTAERLKRNFNFLRKQKGKLSPWKMNIFRFLSLPFLANILVVTFGSSFGDKFMYQHAMKAPDEMRELHKQFYAYMKKMKKCGCKAKKVQ